MPGARRAGGLPWDQRLSLERGPTSVAILPASRGEPLNGGGTDVRACGDTYSRNSAVACRHSSASATSARDGGSWLRRPRTRHGARVSRLTARVHAYASARVAPRRWREALG